MGPTKVYKTKYEAPDTIRGMFGLTDTRNSTHGSGKVKIYVQYFTIYLSFYSLKSSFKKKKKMLCNSCSLFHVWSTVNEDG